VLSIREKHFKSKRIVGLTTSKTRTDNAHTRLVLSVTRIALAGNGDCLRVDVKVGLHDGGLQLAIKTKSSNDVSGSIDFQT
jgi:hypothetical protein